MTNQVDIFKKYGLGENGFTKVEQPMRKHSSTILHNDEEIFESPIPEGQKLKKKDLLRYENVNTIRNYMSANKGADYMDMDKETLVEDFVDHMRFFNTNSLGTAGEVRFISKADDNTKAMAAEAYNLYDSMGNVFVNDGAYGAIDGVKDYVFAAVADPTNLVGVLTGGFGKAAALGVTQGSKQALRQAASQAAKRAAQNGATKEAAENAGIEAGTLMAQRMIAKSASGKEVAAAARKAARVAKAEVRLKAAQAAASGVAKDRLKKAGKAAALQTTAIDGLIAGLQDMSIQNMYIDVGAQEEYSQLQTGLSLALGGVGGGLHYAFGKFEGASGLGDAVSEAKALSRAGVASEILDNVKLKSINKDIEAAEAMPAATKGQKTAKTRKINQLKAEKRKLKREIVGKPLLPDVKDQERATKAIKDGIKRWDEKVKSGEYLTEGYTADDISQEAVAIPEILLKQIMLGDGNKGGVAAVFRERGIKLRRDTKVSDIMTNLVRFMPEEDLQEISTLFRERVSLTLGETADLGVEIGEIIAADVSKAGKKLAVMSQVRRTIDYGVVAGNEILASTLQSKEIRDTLEEEGLLGTAKKAKRISYGQNVWKRLLVSSPATTAANVMGYGQFFSGQVIADIFSGGLMMVGAAGKLAIGDAKGARELTRQAKVYAQIQAQKMKNFADPFTTHDSYMKLMKEIKDETGNTDIQSLLFETVAGGVERSAKRFSMDPDDPTYKAVERLTNASMQITGVRVQDTFTKSQMFMTELDKNLRLKGARLDKELNLSDVLKQGKLEEIDDDVIGGAIDTTLRSVFSKDYTTNDQMLGEVAKFVEKASNTPGLGTIIPFGRFMNNVVATAYQWGPASLLPAAARIAKDGDIQSVEALSRAMVGSAGLGLAMLYSEKQEKQGLAFNEINAGGGTVVDVRNVFPMSAFLAMGRAANLKRKGEPVPKELIQEIGNQLAIGQVARDAQFSNDLYNIFDMMFNEGGGNRGTTLDALYKTTGNISAGFTRPLDAVNRMVGFLTETDTAKDIRQARGGAVFTQSATKYFDNILEVLVGETENITGEKLRLATREGDIYDANPLARILGISIKQGKTAAEKAYSLAELQTWTADQRGKIPTYDRIFNESIAPLLEPKMTRLLKDKRFTEGQGLPEGTSLLQYRRDRVKYELSQARKETREMLDYYENPGFLDRLRYRASTKGSKEQQEEALKYMQRNGVSATSIRDFNFRELNMFNSYIDHLQYIKKGN
jgi:hypothetical protein